MPTTFSNVREDLILSQILEMMKQADIPFCVWKNLQERGLMLAHRTDVDIYVPMIAKGAFDALCRELGGVPVKSNVKNFSGITHVLFAGRNATIIHLHVYNMIFTGESHIKDYMLPIGRMLIEDRRPDDELGYVVSSRMENLLTTIRLYIKGSSLMGLCLYWRDRKDYARQRARIQPSAGLPPEVPVIGHGRAARLMERIVNAGVIEAFVLGKRLRFQMAGLRRFSPFASFVSSHLAISAHLFNRITRRERKTLQGYGRFIALTGPDGAGKTTVLDGLSKALGAKFSIRRVHFGRPPPTLLTMPVHGALMLRRRLRARSVSPAPVELDPAQHGAITALRYLALAYDRNRLGRRVMRYLCRGYIVLSDRLPSRDIGKMDSPKLDPLRSSTAFVRRMAILEHRLYEGIIPPNMLIEFSVSEAQALERNRGRDKKFKETDEEIISRHRSNSGLTFDADLKVNFENDADVYSAIRRLFFRIWPILT